MRRRHSHECLGFNPFSFRSPSKRRDAPKSMKSWGFNPFSFRSPSKRGLFAQGRRIRVSIPSPSGLLQNMMRLNTHEAPRRFNPFSFRSPSKPRRVDRLLALPPFQSLLLQVSFKTPYAPEIIFGYVSIPSPSGLLQNGMSRLT